jgi:molecular chaperone DnaJ
VKGRDYYAELEVARTASSDEINQAFRRLAARYHPDRNAGDKAAEDRFKRIAEAYQVLRDPKTRATYDQAGDEAVRAEPGFRGFDSIDDLLTQFSGLFGDGFGDRLRREAFGGRGRDVRGEIFLSLEEAVLGGSRELSVDAEGDCGRCDGSGGILRERREDRRFVQVRASCPECDGAGRVLKDRTLEVRIPAGIEEGTLLRLRGMGEPGPTGGGPGDLLLRVRIEPGSRHERSGLDLRLRLRVDARTAEGGGRVDVPLLRGSAEMKVPPGTRTGQRFRLAGLGLPAPDGRKGDLIVIVEVVP